MALPTRQQVLDDARAAGWRVAAVLPIHYPRPLLRAYGIHPIEVWGPPGVIASKDDSHFQPYTCAIVQNATFFLQTEAGRQVDCILIPHTCDALQGMGSVFQCFVKPRQPVLTLYHPRGARRDCDADFLADELRRLGGELGTVSGRTPGEEELHAAIETEAAADGVFNELCLHRTEYDVDDRVFYTTLRTREYLPAERFMEVVRALPRAAATVSGPGVFVSGIVPEPMSLFDHMNERGARVVGDDLACLTRRTYATNGETDPWRRMARQLLSMPPDPTIGSPIAERNAYLVRRMRESGARGLLVYDVKFCEPELFYLPRLQEACKAEGWPVLHVEVELGDTIPGQVLNRIDAFLEMLQ